MATVAFTVYSFHKVPKLVATVESVVFNYKYAMAYASTKSVLWNLMKSFLQLGRLHDDIFLFYV